MSLSKNFFSRHLSPDKTRKSHLDVAKASIVVVPGITAGLNSTVRESMIMGMPTICYETNETQKINFDDVSLITAPMNDIDALSNLMLFSLEHPSETLRIAKRGKSYAERFFTRYYLQQDSIFI